MARGPTHGLPSTELAKLPLAEFIPAISPRFAAPHHLWPLLDFFERIDRGEEVRGLCSVPRRHGKTETLLHGIAWLLLRHPDWLIGYAGYNDDFVRSKSRQARDYARRAGVQLRDDSTSVNEWLTHQGGGLIARGVGGSWTGYGVQLFIVDDPHKNRTEAESPARRRAVHDFHDSAGVTSVEPGGSMLGVHTRWHTDDYIGRLSRQDGWTYINQPAINDDGSDRTRELGEALWPDRWPLERLLKRRGEITDFEWASLFQGRPRPRGGQVFESPHFYREFPRVARYAHGVDLAYTAKTQADRSVCLTLAKSDEILYVADLISQQVEAPKFASKLKQVQQRRPAPMLFVGSGTEKGSASFMKLDVPRLMFRTTTMDKFTRALPAAGKWNNGKLLVPDPDVFDVPWLPDFLDVVDNFTGQNDPRDDEVDALGAAERLLAIKSGGTRRGHHRQGAGRRC